MQTAECELPASALPSGLGCLPYDVLRYHFTPAPVDTAHRYYSSNKYEYYWYYVWSTRRYHRVWLILVV